MQWSVMHLLHLNQTESVIEPLNPQSSHHHRNPKASSQTLRFSVRKQSTPANGEVAQWLAPEPGRKTAANPTATELYQSMIEPLGLWLCCAPSSWNLLTRTEFRNHSNRTVSGYSGNSDMTYMTDSHDKWSPETWDLRHHLITYTTSDRLDHNRHRPPCCIQIHNAKLTMLNHTRPKWVFHCFCHRSPLCYTGWGASQPVYSQQAQNYKIIKSVDLRPIEAGTSQCSMCWHHAVSLVKALYSFCSVPGLPLYQKHIPQFMGDLEAPNVDPALLQFFGFSGLLVVWERSACTSVMVSNISTWKIFSFSYRIKTTATIGHRTMDHSTRNFQFSMINEILLHSGCETKAGCQIWFQHRLKSKWPSKGPT